MESINILISAILSKSSAKDIEQELKKISNNLPKMEVKADIDKVAQQFKILADGTKELSKVTSDTTNQLGQQVKTIFNVDKETKQLIADSQVVVENYQKQRAEIEKINALQSKQISQKVKETVSDMTRKPDDLIKMADYYKKMEVESANLARIDEQREQKELSYWSKLRKESVEQLTAKNTEIQKMNQYYSQLERETAQEAKNTIELEKQIALFQKRMQLESQRVIGKYGSSVDSKALNEFKSQLSSLSSSTPDVTNKMRQMSLGMREIEIGAKNGSRSIMGLSSELIKNASKFTEWYLLAGGITGVIGAIKGGLSTLKELDSIMVDISKVTDLTSDSMDRLKKGSFDVANNFGRTAQDYLKSVAEFARAGYEDKASGLSQVSLLGQNVGELTADQANSFLLATDAAYKYSGSQEKLMQVLDGVNQIDNKFATSIQKVSEGISVAGSVASNAGVGVDELSAAVGTMTAITQKSGNEAGRAFRSILMNIRQIKG